MEGGLISLSLRFCNMRKQEWRSSHGIKKNSASLYAQIRLVLTYTTKLLSEALRSSVICVWKTENIYKPDEFLVNMKTFLVKEFQKLSVYLNGYFRQNRSVGPSNRMRKHTEKAEFVLSGWRKKRERMLVGLKFSAPPEGKVFVLGCHLYNSLQGRM